MGFSIFVAGRTMRNKAPIEFRNIKKLLGAGFDPRGHLALSLRAPVIWKSEHKIGVKTPNTTRKQIATGELVLITSMENSHGLANILYEEQTWFAEPALFRITYMDDCLKGMTITDSGVHGPDGRVDDLLLDDRRFLKALVPLKGGSFKRRVKGCTHMVNWGPKHGNKRLKHAQKFNVESLSVGEFHELIYGDPPGGWNG